ncbi:MAG TPA: JAB domain-containing protein, partial [Myxococcales bacterium LLY-WYZ-16_1]|nr:JAB domain-containing protein [Myxococcales bacterium LLY-WYZ-16_1]
METNASSGREVRWLSAVTGEPRSRCARALDRVGGLQGLLLQGPPGVAGLLSDRGARRLTAALRLHRRWSEHARAPDRRPPVLQPADVAACLGPRRRGRSVECFWVLGLDARSRLLAVAEVARGTVSACLVHPRECFWP